jgi:hypothetical protein
MMFLLYPLCFRTFQSSMLSHTMPNVWDSKGEDETTNGEDETTMLKVINAKETSNIKHLLPYPAVDNTLFIDHCGSITPAVLAGLKSHCIGDEYEISKSDLFSKLRKIEEFSTMYTQRNIAIWRSYFQVFIFCVLLIQVGWFSRRLR